MISSEKNGRRASVKFGSFLGEAGVRDREDGLLEVAFFWPDFRSLRRVSSGTVGDQSVEVLKVERSDWVTGMLVVTCRPKSSDEHGEE